MMGAALGGIMAHVLPGAQPRRLGAARHGRRPGRRDPVAVHRHHLRLRAHPRPEQPAALAGRGHGRPLVSVLVLKRSILTEKVARRGFHVMREYAVDPLEATFVREVMDTDVYTVEPTRLLSRTLQYLA